MIAYASYPMSKRNLKGIIERGWRVLRRPMRLDALTPELRYALDNGAWTAYQQGSPFDVPAFTKALRLLGAGADWTVIPDEVAGGLRSLEMSLKWMRAVLDESPRALLAVQDGMSVNDVRPFIGARVGIFVGGSTAWKLLTLAQWVTLANSVGAWCHVGRVNSVKRIALCAGAGATSFDGTSASRYAVTLPKLANANNQMVWRM